MAKGIDIYSGQHPNGAQINYAQAAEGLDFVIVKLTEAGGYVNPYAAMDLAGFKALGKRVAGYHFVRYGSTAQDQIAIINSHLNSVEFVWLDCEVADGATPQAYDAMLEQIVAGVGPKVGIYDNQSFSAFIQSGGFAETLPLWFADPSNTDPSRPRLITQTGQGPVPGIIGDVDYDEWDDASFALGWPAPAALAPAAIDPTPVTEPAAPVPQPEPVQPAPAPEPSPAPAPAAPWYQEVVDQMTEIKEGANGVEVKRLQGLLNAWGSSLAQDGVFGPLTLREVLAFQHEQKIAADGIVGPITWSRLLGV